MHFIQNIWLATHGLWVLVFFLGFLALVAYMNNKMKLLRRVTAAIAVTCMLSFSLSFFTETSSQEVKSGLMSQIQNQEDQISSGSVFSKVYDMVFTILKDKITD